MTERTFAGRFEGQVAVITGGASGIGLEVATRLAREGARVSLWDRDAGRLEAARAASGAADIRVLDIADAADVARIAEETAAALGRIDVLVCSAGITGRTRRS